jgi:hypothetical protein
MDGIIYICLKKNLLIILYLSVACSALAQFQYAIDQSIPVEADGSRLSMPWAGGLNSPQINTMDLNGDNQNDLVIYDKGVGKIWTFLRSKTTYQYAPEFETLFPEDIQSFVLLRDYNCDGKKDLFTFNNSINGVSVYQNTTAANDKLSWQKVKIYIPSTKAYTEILLTQGFNLVNILPGYDDIPNIADMDGDGDLDILNMRFVNPSTAEYHQNLSMEKYGVCDSLVFKRVTQRWGDWEECTCGVMAFGTNCTTTGRTEHTGGKSLLTLDMDNDGDQDILYSEEKCSQLYYLPNIGTSSDPLMNSLSAFPSTNPVNFPLFPSPFLEDIDLDGLKDLLVAPNINVRTVFNTDFSQSLWLYKNTGTGQVPDFTLTKRDFLQDQMIDVGDNSVPAFFDYDGDGDQDLFIGTFTSSADFTGRLFLYENTGSAASPSFKFNTDDFATLSVLRLYNIRPQFADLDGDGIFDLAFTATEFQDGTTFLYFLPGKNKDKLDVSFSGVVNTNFSLGNTENILLTDVNKDGVVDILLGKSTGALQYLENAGSAGSFNFILKNPSFLNLGITTARQNLSITVSDLDADGYEDLITGDQAGHLTVYNNYTSTNPIPNGKTDIIYDSLNNIYVSKNFGGRVWPTVVNLFNTDKPTLAVGNTTGGIYILKSDDSNVLPDEPAITISPNPLPNNETLNIKSDRNVTVQIFSLLGQKMSEPLFVPANQIYPLTIQNLARGIYIARFIANGKSLAKKFVVE